MSERESPSRVVYVEEEVLAASEVSKRGGGGDVERGGRKSRAQARATSRARRSWQVRVGLSNSASLLETLQRRVDG